jgi:SPP1 gp7 family putative phage head morphogenesis protein
MAPATKTRNVNTRLRDHAIRHGLLLHEYSTGEVHRMVRFLNTQVEPDLVRKIANSYDDLEVARAQAVQGGVRKIVAAGYDRLHGRFDADMLDLADAEADIQRAALRGTLPVDLDVVTPSVPTLREMVRNRPIDGKFVKDMFDQMSAATANRVNQQIMIGVTGGETLDQVITRIRGTRAKHFSDGVLNTGRREIETIVRTAIAGVSDNVRQATFEANADLLKGWVFVATLDLKTCLVCAHLDGNVYPLRDGPRTPLHPRCRCSRSPVTKSWKELGLSLREVPEGARASMDGQVPAATTLADWIADRTLEELEIVMGKARAGMFRDGRLKLRDLVDDNSRVLTLAELRRRAS